MATLVARNANVAIVLPWWGLTESEVWEFGGRFCVCRNWQDSGFSRHEDVLTFNLLFKTFYKLCTFNVTFKDNAPINCFAVYQKKKFILVNYDGSYDASYLKSTV
jgi:hypothetical protein